MDAKLKQKLIEQAIEAKQHSYSPYSRFRVGCSLVTEDGHFFTGCNVENASYGLTICAERTALCKAVSEGFKKFKAIAVTTDVKNSFVFPCGACRQFIAEFGVDWDLLIIKSKDDCYECKVSDIIPFTFDNSQLNCD